MWVFFSTHNADHSHYADHTDDAHDSNHTDNSHYANHSYYSNHTDDAHNTNEAEPWSLLQHGAGLRAEEIPLLKPRLREADVGSVCGDLRILRVQ